LNQIHKKSQGNSKDWYFKIYRNKYSCFECVSYFQKYLCNHERLQLFWEIVQIFL